MSSPPSNEVAAETAAAPGAGSSPHNPSNYQPVSTWSGRLIFNRDKRLPNGAVLIEVVNAPTEHSNLVGKEVELRWDMDGDDDDSKELKEYVKFVTADITFEDEAIKSVSVGRIHPERLNGLKKVGPLESLAAARPDNDMCVIFEENSVKVIDDAILAISQPPIQIRGKVKCLASFKQKMKEDSNWTYYQIQHYNPTTKSFEHDGEFETIKIPKVPKNNRGLHTSTCNEIEKSPVNQYGWYLYGHVDAGGVFTVEAWEPRRALLVDGSALDHIALGVTDAVDAIENVIWAETRYKKGTVQSFLLDSESADKNSAKKAWTTKVGEKFLVIHLFGGIGGPVVNEETPLGLIPGHFAFGNATIVVDSFTHELQFRIIHRQVYAHNHGGIISGPNMWCSFMGDLHRGWFGTRPVSEIIIQCDPISRIYDFGNDEIQKKLCPLNEMIRELNEMGARYRTGDGDGSALVSTAHSCVQDSNQAMFAALNETSRKFETNPQVQEWKNSHPNAPQTKSLIKLENLYKDISAYLTPFGVRKDWDETAKGLKGTENQTTIITLMETIRGYGTVVPRRSHDELAKIFLKHGAKLWFIRTNQIGGHDPTIIPLAPARIFQFKDNAKRPEDGGDRGIASVLCCCKS